MTTVLSSSTENPCVISSKPIVQRILATVRETVVTTGITPGLAVILVGDDLASRVYVRNKGVQAEACGFSSRQFDLPATVSESEILQLIEALNKDPEVHGVLVQLPLPSHLDVMKVTQAVHPAKDVDGFHHLNMGRLAAGRADGTGVPCTPAGAMLLIKEVLGDDLKGKHAVVVGRSNIVGKPLAQLLLNENCTVTIIHSHTENAPELARVADILVVAAGVAGLVNADWIKPGAVVIDVGINRRNDADGMVRLVGDVDYVSALTRAGAITPVPGGVGPLTIAMLMQNTLQAALAQRS